MKSAALLLGAAVLAIAMAAGASITAQSSTGATPTFNKDVAAILFTTA